MQPLSLVKYVEATDWGSSHLVMTKRPALAVKVAQSISYWAEIEAFLGMFLAFLLHSNEKAALAIYSGLENRSAQLRMIGSAATAVLPVEHADLVSVLLSGFVRPAMRYRDKLAHWCWGFTEELPDALLIRTPEAHLFVIAASLRKQAETGKWINPVTVNHDTVFVVREGDLDRYLKQLSQLELYLRQTMASVWASNSEGERAEYLQKLSNEPQFQAGLVKLRKDRQRILDTQQEASPPNQSGEA